MRGSEELNELVCLLRRLSTSAPARHVHVLQSPRPIETLLDKVFLISHCFAQGPGSRVLNALRKVKILAACELSRYVTAGDRGQKKAGR